MLRKRCPAAIQRSQALRSTTPLPRCPLSPRLNSKSTRSGRGTGGNRRENRQHKPLSALPSDGDRLNSTNRNSSESSDDRCGDIVTREKFSANGTRETRGGKPEPAAGGWFATDSQVVKEEEKLQGYEANDASSDNIVNPARWRVGKTGSIAGSNSNNKKGDDGHGSSSDEGRDALSPSVEATGCAQRSLLMLSYERGPGSDMMQCIIVRDVSVVCTSVLLHSIRV